MRLGSLVFHQQRVEGFGIGPQAEAQLALARLGQQGASKQQRDRNAYQHGDAVLGAQQKLQAAHHHHQQHRRRQHPRILEHGGVIFELPQQRAPGWQRLGDAQPEQPQIRLAQNEHRHRNPELGQQNRPQIRQQVAPEQPPSRDAAGAGLDQKIGVHQRPGSGANDARGAGPSETTQQQKGDGDRCDRRGVQRQQGAHGQQQKQPRQRQETDRWRRSRRAPSDRPGNRPCRRSKPRSASKAEPRRARAAAKRACRRAGAPTDRGPGHRCPARNAPRAER